MAFLLPVCQFKNTAVSPSLAPVRLLRAAPERPDPAAGSHAHLPLSPRHRREECAGRRSRHFFAAATAPFPSKPAEMTAPALALAVVGYWAARQPRGPDALHRQGPQAVDSGDRVQRREGHPGRRLQEDGGRHLAGPCHQWQL